MQQLLEEFISNAKRFAKIELVNLYSKKINQAQKREDAQAIYTQTLRPYLLDDGFNIALHPDAKELDSFEFAKILEREERVAFFIGGAYGFGEDFLQLCDMKMSLSKLTMSHKVAKIVLLEQIFRGFSIIHNHPYHK